MALSWKRLSAFLGILGGIIFVIVTFIAMLTYPGGYSFFDNYFSELGLTVTNGTPSLLNYALFIVACSSAALCLIPFLLAMQTVFTETKSLTALSWTGTIFGIAAAPNLAFLAIFAANIQAILLKKEYPNLYAIIGLAVVVICFLLIGAFFVPALEFFGSALWQKVSVYALILWSAFQGYYLLKIFQ